MPSLPKPETVRSPGVLHRGATPGATPRLRGRKLQARNARLYRRHPLCVACLERGKLTEAVEWDHIEPLHRGGPEAEGNLQGLCSACHQAKTLAERKARGGRS
jgi:5-methylcytosine-specific restriction enzyme A